MAMGSSPGAVRALHSGAAARLLTEDPLKQEPRDVNQGRAVESQRGRQRDTGQLGKALRSSTAMSEVEPGFGTWSLATAFVPRQAEDLRCFSPDEFHDSLLPCCSGR